ncbi:glucose-1-phosphate cytidylyltransferase [Candidatus Pelagibacter sp. HIMB1593]|uniref:glucose-1-phosphate cytidylyltransferase n=1 Tax=Candidatus Pelagibacter sp. HIMB1593 TaxID=3413355 RepID=UPI003F836777
MKAVILAGGLGTRISEDTQLKPKPMIEIGGKPLLWHIMKTYSLGGVNNFVICCGYKGEAIKEYFSKYFLYNSDITIDLSNNNLEVHQRNSEPWKITLVDTGEKTNTGGRLKRVSKYLENEKAFCFTYGDGLSDIDILSLIKFHKNHKKLATITAVVQPGRFGVLELSGAEVNKFTEKPRGDGSLINGGFFVLSPKCLNLIENDSIQWENEPLKNLVKKNQLMAYLHDGFWQPMDTLREKKLLETLWESGKAPWKKWS